MKPSALFLLVFSTSFFFQFCKNSGGEAEKIALLEQEIAANFTPEKGSQLVSLYKKQVEKSPGDHAENYAYLLRGAELQFYQMKDGPGAFKMLEEALGKHSEGQNRTDALALASRMWSNFMYKMTATGHLGPYDVENLRNILLKNTQWSDSALIRLDKKMSANLTNIDKKTAQAYIEIAEANGDLMQVENPGRFVELFLKAAGIAKSAENFNKSVSLYHAIKEYQPEHPKAPTALFMMGFVYENDLQDIEKARAAYEEFLKKYPKDPDYADDAKMSLKNLGKSPDELIKEFEKQK